MKIVTCCIALVLSMVCVCPALADGEAASDSGADDVAAVKQAVHSVFESIKHGELEELAHQHLNSEDFSKWPDGGAPSILGYDAAIELETTMFSAMTSLEYTIQDLRVAVIGPAAIATFVISYDIAFGGDSMSASERSTLVFAKGEGDWKIVHEHFSPVAVD